MPRFPYVKVIFQTKERYFCFADGQPNSEKSIAFLSTLVAVAKERCQRALIVMWDRATWHISKKVTKWVRQHNRQVKQSGDGVRLLTCLLPTKSPWLNPMEPIWRLAKRKVVEPDSDLSPQKQQLGRDNLIPQLGRFSFQVLNLPLFELQFIFGCAQRSIFLALG